MIQRTFFNWPFWNKWITGVKLLQSLQSNDERRQRASRLCVKSAVFGVRTSLRSEILGSDLRKETQMFPCLSLSSCLSSSWININPVLEGERNMFLCVFQRVDVCAQFECRSQFKVHGADQVLLCEQQQSLAVYFLGTKLLGYNLTTWRERERERERLNWVCFDVIC